MSYKIEFTRTARKDLKKLPQTVIDALENDIKPKLIKEPLSFEPLKGELFLGVRKFNLPQNHRGAFHLNKKENLVTILIVGVRENIYKKLHRRL